MMWSDMFFKLGSELGYYSDSYEVPQEAIELVPENIELVYWDYSPTEQAHYEKLIKKHQKFQRNLWFAGCAKSGRTYHAPNEVFMNALAASIPACKETGVDNVMITVWGDYGNECTTVR